MARVVKGSHSLMDGRLSWPSIPPSDSKLCKLSSVERVKVWARQAVADAGGGDGDAVPRSRRVVRCCY